MEAKMTAKSLWQRIATGLLLVVIPLLLTGCGPTNNTPSPNGLRLTIWRVPVNGKADDQAFATILAAYKKKYPNVTVNYKTFKPDEDYETAVLNALAAGNGPDIWEIRENELARHKDKLAPVGRDKPVDIAQFKKVYASSIAEEMISDGQLYGLPIGIDPLVLYVNTRHLQELQSDQTIPKTWNEIRELAVKLTRKVNNYIVRPGFAMGSASNIDRSAQIIELLMLQVKTQMVDPAHRNATFHLYTQDAQNQSFHFPAQDALAFYYGFANSLSGYQTWDTTQPYSTEAFTTGNLSMMIDYLSTASQIRQLNPALEFTVSRVPQLDQKTFPKEDIPGSVNDPVFTAKYRALVASKPSPKLSKEQQNAKRDLAWQFIEFAATESANTVPYSQATGLIPPQIVPDQAATSTGNLATTIAAVVNPYLSTWYKGRSPRNVELIMKQMLIAITEQDQLPEPILQQAAQAVTELLK